MGVQMDFLGQIMQDQQWSINFNLRDLDVGQGSRQHRAAIGLLTDIANETLDNFAFDTPIFNFGEVGFIALFNLTNKAHVVSTIDTTPQNAITFLEIGMCSGAP